MFQLIKKMGQLISSQIPQEVTLSECEWRRLLALHDIVSPDATRQDAIRKAINRIYAQLDTNNPCSCRKTGVLLYDDDIQALKTLINNHCITIAIIHAEAEGILAYTAEKQYEAYTHLMLRIR
jgi:hypothetical protein